MGLAVFAWKERCFRLTCWVSWSAQWWRWPSLWCSTWSTGSSWRRYTCARPGHAPTPSTATCPDPRRRTSSSSSCWWWLACLCCSPCWSSTTSAGRASRGACERRRYRGTTTELWRWPCLPHWSPTAPLAPRPPAPHPLTSASAWQPRAPWTPWPPWPRIPSTTGWHCSRTRSTWPPSGTTAATTWRTRKTSWGWDTSNRPQSCPTAAPRPRCCTLATWRTNAGWARPAGAAAGLAKTTCQFRLRTIGGGGKGLDLQSQRERDPKIGLGRDNKWNFRHCSLTLDCRGWTKCSL